MSVPRSTTVLHGGQVRKLEAKERRSVQLRLRGLSSSQILQCVASQFICVERMRQMLFQLNYGTRFAYQTRLAAQISIEHSK